LDLLEFDFHRACSILATLKPAMSSKLTLKEYREQRRAYCQRALEKELRCCLTVKGRPLIGWDVKSMPQIAARFFGPVR
jgi:hypothetical protein